MKKLVLLTTAMVLSLGVAQADVYVNGYYKKNGTYVKQHYRTNRDGYKYNNYSYGK